MIHWIWLIFLFAQCLMLVNKISLCNCCIWGLCNLKSIYFHKLADFSQNPMFDYSLKKCVTPFSFYMKFD